MRPVVTFAGAARATGAEIIGRALAEAGATHAFGIPGGEVLALIEGLGTAGIDFVLARHESAAGFMAEGLWHATGALPVLVATLGPGVANAVNVVANASQDRVPLIFLSGCIEAAMAESYTHQVVDHRAMLRPVVKASLRAEKHAVGVTIAKAIAIAREGQPGPVHVDVPTDVAESAAEDGRAVPPPTAVFAPPAHEDGLRIASEMLAAAERPVAIAGLDALNEAAAAELAAFCHAQGVPLVTTYKAKGLLSERDPLALGCAGLSPKADAILMPLIAASDCLVLVGYDPIEMRAGWRHPWGPDKPVIELAGVERRHGMHGVTLDLRGAIAPSLARLAGVPRRGRRWPDGEPALARERLAGAFAAEGFGPAAIFHALRAAMPEGAVATADSGAHRILFSHVWRCHGSRQLLQSTGFCTMACAVPLAAGFRLGRPDTPVLAVVGDAGLEMGLGELATLRDLGLAVIVVVLVDGKLALIDMKQRASGRPRSGVDFGRSDLPAVARAMGGCGAWIDDLESLDAEIAAALDRGSFTLLACRIGPEAYDGAF